MEIILQSQNAKQLVLPNEFECIFFGQLNLFRVNRAGAATSGETGWEPDHIMYNTGQNFIDHVTCPKVFSLDP